MFKDEAPIINLKAEVLSYIIGSIIVLSNHGNALRVEYVL